MPDVSIRSQIAPFLAMDVLREANRREAAGQKIYHLETGQPGTPAPQAALLAVQETLRREPLGYTDALGRPALKEAIARLYRDRYGLNVDPSRVVTTTGSSAGFILSFLAAFDAGQRLVMGTPGYPAYRNTALALNIEPICIPAGLATGFQLPLDRLAQVENAHGLLIASPGNPTGTLISPADLASIAEICRAKNWRLISDEIYHGLSYDSPAASILEFAPDAIVVNSFSKYFSMTGWRIGWMIVPPGMVRAVERLAQNLFISPPAISQIAAEAALSSEARRELEGHTQSYRRNRDVLLAALQRGGVRDVAPADGAFYLYACVEPFCADSRDFAARLLEETGVAATPGWDFDPVEGGKWIRFSTAGTQGDIDAAAALLSPWLSHSLRR